MKQTVVHRIEGEAREQLNALIAAGKFRPPRDCQLLGVVHVPKRANGTQPAVFYWRKVYPDMGDKLKLTTLAHVIE